MSRKVTNTVFAIAVCFGVLFAISAGHGQGSKARSVAQEENSKASQDGGPENTSNGVFKSPTEYAKLIEPHLGIPPVVDLEACVEIPIFVDGKKFIGDPGIH